MEHKNKFDKYTTIVSIASVLGKVLDHYGLDKYAIAKKVGIDIEVAYKPNDRVSTAKIQKVWAIASSETGDGCIGLTYAEFLQPASLCGLGLSWITSDTLKDSILRLVKYQRAISTAIDFSLNELSDCYQIIFRSKLEAPVHASFDAAVATLFQMCRLTYGPELVLEKVSIAHAALECAKKSNDFFGVQVEFDAQLQGVGVSRQLPGWRAF